MDENTHELTALAVKNAWSMWKSSSLICEMIIHGEYTPDAASAAPKTAPEANLAIKADIVEECSGDGLFLRESSEFHRLN